MGSRKFAGSGLTRRGVITNTSSERSVWNSVLRNSAPTTGNSPMNGNALMLVVVLFLMSPPIAKLWPSISCTVVSALREVKDGNTALTPPALIWMPAALSSDTSGRTRRLMRPLPNTVGVNFTETPNSFSSSVTVRPPPLLLSCDTGMKILPPARKLPVCPLIAITVGSASILTRPSVFCMFSTPLVTPRPGTVP